ncbi:MAG: D-ribose pyranase [Gammaproteobacteria bacterium]|nr:D-ribose pyranase [Gammaproteobacteria bacterium]
MKKAVLLNAPISRVVSLLGHGDYLCLGDAGLPVPDGVERIDLAVHAGLPSFLETLSTITSEMYVERAVVATELLENQPEFYARIREVIKHLAQEQGNDITIETVSHESFKDLTRDCKAVVRTGECTPYANILLYAGVTF